MDESSEDEEEDDSSDDDHTWTKEVKKQHRIIEREHKAKERAEAMENGNNDSNATPKLFALRQGEEFKGIHNLKHKINK